LKPPSGWFLISGPQNDIHALSAQTIKRIALLVLFSLGSLSLIANRFFVICQMVRKGRKEMNKEIKQKGVCFFPCIVLCVQALVFLLFFWLTLPREDYENSRIQQLDSLVVYKICCLWFHLFLFQ